MEYLMTQEVHTSQYYTEINFLTVPIEIYELIKSTKKIQIATDGGPIPLKGSLGFVFADEDGTILLTCFGQPSGNDPLSFRLEICAFLAAVRLVTLVTRYFDGILPCVEPVRSKIQVYTDSLRMIKYTTSILQRHWKKYLIQTGMYYRHYIGCITMVYNVSTN
jgi:hypothetical protein